MDLVASTQSWDVKQTFVSCYVHSGLQILVAAFQVVLALVIGFSMFSEHLLLEVDCLIYISTSNTREKIITVLVRKVVSILPAPCCSILDTETFFSVCSPDSESRRADKIFFHLCQHYRWNQDAFWTLVGQVSPLAVFLLDPQTCSRSGWYSAPFPDCYANFLQKPEPY